MSDVSRRDFMKTAGVVGAGVTMATGFAPFSYAANEKVRVGCIGTGGQGTFHIRDGMAGAEAIEIVAVADCFFPNQRSAVIYGQCSNAGIGFKAGETPGMLSASQREVAKAARRPNAYYDYKEMLEKEELDAVVIATPLDQHFPMTMDCLDAGKWVFCEKTLIYTVEEGQKLLAKCNETGKFVQVGHQRRYNPKYNLGMQIAYEQGLLGRITHITAQWHRNNFWRRPLPEGYQLNDQEKAFIDDLEHHINWRLYDQYSGGLFTELATHQTDIANWFLKACPSRVHAFGGLDYWRDGREVDDNIVIAFEYDLKPSDEGFMPVDARSSMQNMAALNREYTVRFMYSSIQTNAKRGASELIQGDWGSLELTEGKCWLYGEPAPWAEQEAKMAAAAAAKSEKEEDSGDEAAGGDDEWDASNKITSGATLGLSNKELTEGKELLADRKLKTADVYQFEAFAHHIKNGGVPKNNQMTGYVTALGAIAAMESRKTGKTVELDPAWMQFDFETPSFHGFDYNDDDYAEA